MTIYYGESDGVYNFHDSELGKIPDEAIEVSNQLYSQLVLARSRGASLSVSDGKVIALSHDGTVIDVENMKDDERYHAPVKLSDKAKSCLSKARDHVYHNYGILNEPTPDEWVSYLRALMAIVNGTDTASTELPQEPVS